MTAISRLLVHAGRAELEAITFDALAQAAGPIGKLHPAGHLDSSRRRFATMISTCQSTTHVDNLLGKILTFDSPENPSGGRV
jgi:hypothetical protein